MIKPPRLEPGQTIGLIAPASGVPNLEKIDRAVAFLQAKGYRVRLGRHVRRRTGYLAGSDRQRLEDLHRMWADPKVNAIICLRGGYGTLRFVHQLDFDLIRKNPKIFMGFSDLTSVHLAILRRTGLVTFHGPMAVSNFANESAPAFTFDAAQGLLSEPRPFGSICAGAPGPKPIVLRGGPPVTAPLTGGNMSLIQTTLGTPFEIQTKGRIVFLEEIGERPYRIDRMLTHLFAAGKLKDAAGIALGLFDDCEEPPDKSKRKKGDDKPVTLLNVLRERLTNLGIPVLLGLPFGHTSVN
ncbi:MAG: LD-carboxypeptidase, partial [bacterium]